MQEAFDDHIVRIEKIALKFRRPRTVGCNARKGPHGSIIKDPVARLHTEGGHIGVGWSSIDKPGAQALLGSPVSSLFYLPDGSLETGRAVDLPLWDLAAKITGQPLYRLLGARGSRDVELYDGSIYIDDLGVGDAEAQEIFRDEVATGQRFGFRNFKIKIGRGARWMPVMEGLERDILVIRTVREAAGEDAKIMIDANNGMTLNIAKEILRRCADLDIYWLEEPFPEDPGYNEPLRAFIDENGYRTLVADGESGPPPPTFFDMVEKGTINVVQQDFRRYGLTWWKSAAERIKPWGARCAPHCWGSAIERFTHAHFAASVPHFALLEAAPVDLPGIVSDGWEMEEGRLRVPDTPGAGFDLDPKVIETGVRAEDGFRVEA